MQLAKAYNSSSIKPEMSKLVSNISMVRSLTVLSFLSPSARFLSSTMIELSGLTSIVFLDDMYDDADESRRAWAFMMRSMPAVQPYSPVTRQHGESTTRCEQTTFSHLSPSTSFMTLHRSSKAALVSSQAAFSSSVSSISRPSFVQQTSFLPSYSLSCWVAYSSIAH